MLEEENNNNLMLVEVEKERLFPTLASVLFWMNTLVLLPYQSKTMSTKN